MIHQTLLRVVSYKLVSTCRYFAQQRKMSGKVFKFYDKEYVSDKLMINKDIIASH